MHTHEIVSQWPAHIGSAGILDRGGYVTGPGFVPPAVAQQLLIEALGCYKHARRSVILQPDDEDMRGGVPARRLSNAPAGRVQDTLYHDPETVEKIASAIGLPVQRTSDRGSYSYYVREGDFLELHRDIDKCDVTMITCLAAQNMDCAQPHGGLVLYPQHVFHPLSQVRKLDVSRGSLIHLPVYSSIVFLGGVVPHQLLPLGRGQTRIVSIMCFRCDGS